MDSIFRSVSKNFNLSAVFIFLLSFTFIIDNVSAQDTQTSVSSDRFADVSSKVEPAVVSIDAKPRTRDVALRGRDDSEAPDEMLEMLRRQMPRQQAMSVGSGFIVDKAGFIITNAHVVENTTRITVKLSTGEEFAAKLIGSDEETDIAVLKIEAGRELPSIPFGNSAAMRVGDWVLALGSPFGLSRTVTAGIISNVQRETPLGSAFQKFIQTDASINRGNSGGPLVNMSGEVIGVNSQIATSSGDSNGIGFALPSSEAEKIYQQLRTDGKIRRGYLGVLLDTVKPEFAAVYDMKDERGAIVTDVRDANGPAALAGIKAGDVIVAVDGKPVHNAQDLIAKVAAVQPNRSISLTYLRDNGTDLVRKNISMTLAERPPQRDVPANNRKSGKDPQPDDTKPFGLTLEPLTPAVATTFKLDLNYGLIVKEINPESFIADVKLSSGVDAIEIGDIIQRMNRTPVRDAATFAAAVRKLKTGDAVVLHIQTPLTQNKTMLKIVQFTVQ